MRITALAGGVGGARFLRGLISAAPDADITVIGNVGDDMTMHGLRICPDLDTVMYTLGGGIHEGQGWGRAEETFGVAEELMGAILNVVMGLLGDLDASLVLELAGMRISIGEISGVEIPVLKIYVTPEGIIYKIEVELSILVEVELDGEPGVVIPVSLEAEISILAVNEGVEITYPDDLEDYVPAAPKPDGVG